MNWDGTPALVIEAESVALRRYRDVDEAFALAEGDNSSLDGWREDHRGYFERNGGFDPEMMVVRERFRLVEDFHKLTAEAEKGDVRMRKTTSETVRQITNLKVRSAQTS